jgi:tetratricopeptide (TPR) repeat protein
MRKGDLTGALADLDKAAEIDPTNFYAFWNRGAVYTSLWDFDRAEQDLTRALSLKPDKTSKAQIEEALNVVLAAAKGVNKKASDPSVIAVPTWGDDGERAARVPAYGLPPGAIGVSPPVAVSPAVPVAPPPMPGR